ncbi:hypothetical protein DYB26_000771, partial [Aphanomyces astaci]
MKARTAGIFAIGLIIRLACVLWAEYQDRTMPVKYTDVDYDVYTDASREILQGNSPFDRTTYRYTPILAYMLLPNVYLHEAWGKLLFVASDMIVGYGTNSGFIMGLVAFLPQFLTLFNISLRCGKDIMHAQFLLTMAFVVFNKVCTAQ